MSTLNIIVDNSVTLNQKRHSKNIKTYLHLTVHFTCLCMMLCAEKQ